MLSQYFEAKNLLPVKDPLDMYLMHAMLGWAIFNEVRPSRLSCKLWTKGYYLGPGSREDCGIFLYI